MVAVVARAGFARVLLALMVLWASIEGAAMLLMCRSPMWRNPAWRYSAWRNPPVFDEVLPDQVEN
jgi:hypothetical protein